MAGLAPSGRDARRVTLRVGVLNGPNLHRLGTRAPDQYGTDTLAQIEEGLRVRADRLGVEIEFYQSDDEDALVERITDRAEAVDGWVVNAAGFTHTSIPIRDALAAAGRPFVEVHLSNVYAREPFRHTSVLADLAVGVIAGFRASSYRFGLEAIVEHLAAADS